MVLQCDSHVFLYLLHIDMHTTVKFVSEYFCPPVGRNSLVDLSVQYALCSLSNDNLKEMLSFKNMKSTIGTVPCQTLFNFLSTEKDQTSFNIWHFKRLILWSWLLFQRADIYFYNAFAILLTLFVWGRMGFWLTGGEMRISRYLWSMLLDDVWMMSLHALQPTNGRSCCHGDLFFFFFPVVKCGQSLKQWNECVNLHKGKERHSRVLECLCLCMCVCVIVCRNACVLLKHFCSQSLLNSTWQSTASYVISGLCYTESWPTRSVDCKINGCYLQYMFLAAKSQRNIQGLCASVFPPPSVRLLKAVKSACRPDLFVSCGISHVV